MFLVRFLMSAILALTLLVVPPAMAETRGKKRPAAPDQSPKVSFILPSPGSVIDGQVLIAGTAQDDDLRAVEVRVRGGSRLRVEGKQRWTANLDTTKLPLGPAVIEATATDRRGNQATNSLTVEIVSTQPTPATPVAAQPDALTREVRNELAVFTDWLKRGNVKGYIGEVGWPKREGSTDYVRWNELAEAWYQDADAADLWVTYFDAGAWENPAYRPSAYWSDSWPGGGPINRIGTQAEVLQRHLGTGSTRRGVHLLSGSPNSEDASPATSTFSNVTPGSYGPGAEGGSYQYDPASSFELLSDEGFDVVRVDFRWERLQPRLFGSLDPAELARLDAAVANATRAGLGVILDLHNYGEYYLWDGGKGVRRTLGSAPLPTTAFIDIWERLARHFADNPTVIAYGLMNEPHDLAPQFNPQRLTYGWDVAADGVQGWSGTAVARSTSTRRTGAGALRVQHPGGNEFWLTDGENHNWQARDLSASGPTFSAWVYVPTDAPEAEYYAALFTGGSQYDNVNGPFAQVRRGQWTQLIVTPPDDHLRANTAISVYLGSSKSLPFEFYVDDVQQGRGLAPVEIWEDASQRAVTAIRAIDRRSTVLVGGYNYSRVQEWADQHPSPWISDPADNIRYEGHHYWDDGSFYDQSYSELNQLAEQAALHNP